MTSVDVDHDSPPPGYLLKELGFVDEIEAAAALDITTPTLIGYRKSGCGPVHTTVGRRIIYSRAELAKWLAAGGTRAPDETS